MKAPSQLAQERKAQARGQLLAAWDALTEAIADPDLNREQLEEFEAALDEAKAVAGEWGIPWHLVIDENARSAA